MRERTRGLLAVLLVGVVGLVGMSCAGAKARQEVLLPALKRLFTDVVAPHVERAAARVEAEDGAGAPAAVTVRAASVACAAALDAGDALALGAVDLDLLYGAAVAGIADRVGEGEIGRDVGVSLQRSVVVWRASCELLLGGGAR